MLLSVTHRERSEQVCWGKRSWPLLCPAEQLIFPYHDLACVFLNFRAGVFLLEQRSPIQSMCGSKKTFGSLVLLCCLFLTECRVLKFVVAVSLLLFVSLVFYSVLYLIHWAIISATSHQMTVALLCIVADYTKFFCLLSIVTFTHLHHKGLLWAANTASHISDRHFVHKPLCISLCYTSSTMEIQWNAIWGFKTQVTNASFHKVVNFHSGCLSHHILH